MTLELARTSKAPELGGCVSRMCEVIGNVIWNGLLVDM